MTTEQLYSIFNFKLLNKILLGASLAVFLFILIDQTFLFISSVNFKKQMLPLGEVKLEFLDERTILVNYLSQFNENGLFFKKAVSTTGAAKNQSIREVLKDYRLNGIVLLDKPEAIFIDARSGKSTFVSEGDKLEDVDVVKIEEGKVTLKYFEESMEMAIK